MDVKAQNYLTASYKGSRFKHCVSVNLFFNRSNCRPMGPHDNQIFSCFYDSFKILMKILVDFKILSFCNIFVFVSVNLCFGLSRQVASVRNVAVQGQKLMCNQSLPSLLVV